ncbi:hypothetical protein MA5S0422_2249 [Mycobacteroides abscessus 5S-0422]|uniref:Uncharacterized protein n=2 Tax=Mycobacteroides abscessus TaxID=36809 RepID=A0A829M600_9MYCO|nr:hypothetical protein MA5S0422_2327 [Mycobacteroides abscessus 5S-0422]EIU27114.1 hypothetical protein MA5S0708_1871 [Mycobacteroides abscessus 5S-0708]EIU35534.1 hypothetical protein MA5S1212_0083 [Mycobacteroides abscessus 5S-1212]EIU62054.1 hypothetical protein MM1S1510930_2384 [Mycobacteroides abscessus subsp. bolletii 1S-151-0930]EIU74957.1 hypothetical protein MM1S1530915_1932 [Mycobacteroides abscessus subsp. bolletii 1S-153-0915]EIV11504.1 hypothetical protein MM2B0912R_2700 [Mycobac
MSPMSLIRRFARFVRQGYPQHAPAVGHCSLLALARTPSASTLIHGDQD